MVVLAMDSQAIWSINQCKCKDGALLVPLLHCKLGVVQATELCLLIGAVSSNDVTRNQISEIWEIIKIIKHLYLLCMALFIDIQIGRVWFGVQFHDWDDIFQIDCSLKNWGRLSFSHFHEDFFNFFFLEACTRICLSKIMAERAMGKRRQWWAELACLADIASYETSKLFSMTSTKPLFEKAEICERCSEKC